MGKAVAVNDHSNSMMQFILFVYSPFPSSFSHIIQPRTILLSGGLSEVRLLWPIASTRVMTPPEGQVLAVRIMQESLTISRPLRGSGMIQIGLNQASKDTGSRILIYHVYG